MKIINDGDTNCVSKCPIEGYYTNLNKKACEKCDSSCKTCSSPENSKKCTSCFDYTYFSASLGTCTSSCPEGTYLLSEDNTK